MTKRTLESLKSAFGSSDTPREAFTNNYYPFWNMQVGDKAVIRFLPDADSNNPRGFMIEKASHSLTINGQKKTVACLSQYDGEDCPICKVSQGYYKVKDEVNGKKYWRKKQYIAQALIVEDPLPADTTTGETSEGKVRYIALGFQIYNIIKEAFAGDDLESIPYSFEDGYDFIIKKTKSGQYDSYAVGTKFSNRSRSLTDQELEIVQEGMVELSTLMPKHPGLEKVQGMLDAEMNGENYSEADGTTDEEFETAKTAAPSPKPGSKKEADDMPAQEKAAGKEESSSNVDDMLAAIQARRAAAKKS